MSDGRKTTIRSFPGVTVGIVLAGWFLFVLLCPESRGLGRPTKRVAYPLLLVGSKDTYLAEVKQRGGPRTFR